MTDLVVSLLALLITGAGAYFFGQHKANAKAVRKAERDYQQRKKEIEDALDLSGDPAAQREWLRDRAKR